MTATPSIVPAPPLEYFDADAGDHPIQLRTLAGRLDARNSNTTTPLAGAVLTTYQWNDEWYQLAVYPAFEPTSGERRPYISRRLLPHGAWETPVDLKAALGNQVVVDNAHRTFAVAVDFAGTIHVVGNMHGSPLRYARSTAPHALTFANVATMVDANREQNMTYPQFVRTSTGQLLFAFRHSPQGSTNNAQLWLYRWHLSAGQWVSCTGSQPWVDGTQANPTLGPYLSRLAIDRRDRLHAFFVWRFSDLDESNAPNHQDLCYVRSDTYGETFVRSNGIAQPVPITPANCEVVIDTADGVDVGLWNNCYTAIDAADRVHALVHINNGAAAGKVRHVYHDGAEWRITELTDKRWQVGRPALVPLPDGRVWAIVHRAGAVRAVDVTPDAAAYGARECVLANLWFNQWDACFDDRALRDLGVLSLLLAPQSDDDWDTAGYHDGAQWQAQWAATMTVDLARWHAIAAGEVRVPQIRTIGSTVGPAANTTVTPGAAQVLLRGPFSWGSSIAGGTQIFARLTAEARRSSAGTTFTLSLIDPMPVFGDQVKARLPFTTGANVFKSTPWVPLDTGIDVFTGWPRVEGQVTAGSGNGLVDAGRIWLELGVLDWPQEPRA